MQFLRLALHYQTFIGLINTLLSIIDEYEKAMADGKLSRAEEKRILGRTVDLLHGVKSLLTGGG